MKWQILFVLVFLAGAAAVADARQPITCAADLDGSIRALPQLSKIDRLAILDDGSAPGESGSDRDRHPSPAREAAEIVRLARAIQFYVVAPPPERVMLSDAGY